MAVILRRQEGTRHMQRGRCSVHALAGMGALVWRRLVYTALCRAPRGGAHNRKVVARAGVYASRPANVCRPSGTLRGGLPTDGWHGCGPLWERPGRGFSGWKWMQWQRRCLQWGFNAPRAKSASAPAQTNTEPVK